LGGYKAQLVANGSSQQLGIDCDETFSPVVKPATIRTVLNLALSPSSTTLLQRIISSLHRVQDDRPWGSQLFLGISVSCDNTKMFLSQRKYALELLQRAHMSNCNPSRLPLIQTLNLALMVCLYMHDLREPHLEALKRILRYVHSTLGFGLQPYASSTTSLIAYSDADWAARPATRRSTSGYYVFLGNNLLSWSSKRQHTLSRSSADVEYRGVANAVAETAWLRNLLLELHTPLLTTTHVYCDNVSAIYLSANHVQHQRIKHIEIDIYFVRDMVSKGQVRVLHVPSLYKYARYLHQRVTLFSV
nr:ribonuclease H-like domain-containing protein [Tanacetum cinerariifolium]